MGCDGPESVLEDAKVEWTEAERKDFRDKADFEGVVVSNSVGQMLGVRIFFFFFFLRQREKISEKKRGRKKGMEHVNKMLRMANIRRFL